MGRCPMRPGRRACRLRPCRAGTSSLEYVLLFSAVLPMVAFATWAGPRIMRLAFDFLCVLISWPYM